MTTSCSAGCDRTAASYESNSFLEQAESREHYPSTFLDDRCLVFDFLDHTHFTGCVRC